MDGGPPVRSDCALVLLLAAEDQERLVSSAFVSVLLGTSVLCQVLGAIATTRAFAAESEEIDRYAEALSKYVRTCYRQARRRLFELERRPQLN